MKTIAFQQCMNPARATYDVTQALDLLLRCR
jgi:hypothetical protein